MDRLASMLLSLPANIAMKRNSKLGNELLQPAKGCCVHSKMHTVKKTLTENTFANTKHVQSWIRNDNGITK